MHINHNLKAVFLHNPKCGGAYMRDILLDIYNFELIYNNTHKNYEKFIYPKKINYNEDTDKHCIRNYGKYRYFSSYNEESELILKTYFIFTFVRNPYERIFSAYNYLKRNLINEKLMNAYEKSEYYENFNVFINNKNNLCNRAYFHAFIPQVEQLLNDSNTININYIGKMETLEYDFINILTILNEDIKHNRELFFNIKHNISEKLDIKKEMNKETFYFINNFFEKDFEIFNYKKYNTYEDFIKYYNVNQNIKIQEENISNNIKLYKELEIINYELLSKNEIIKKLLHELQNSCTNYIKTKHINEIKNEFIENLNYKNNNYKKSKIIIVNNIKNELNITYCTYCSFKSFNLLSKNSHSFYCKNIS